MSLVTKQRRTAMTPFRGLTIPRPSAGFLAVAFAAAAVLAYGRSAAAQASAVPSRGATSLPASMTDSAYWRLGTDLSEVGGHFPYDNFVSNETAFQDVLPRLQASTRPGGVFIGVGPEQNFSYIVALRPRIAFIIDIRREAIIQHLLFKALFELSPDRVTFVSRLFSRPRPSGLATGATPEAIFAAYARVPGDPDLFDQNLAAAERLLVTQHHFALSDADEATLRFIYNAFFRYGPAITYDGTGGPFATFRVMGETADSAGVHRGFLANEENYRVVRDMHARNMIVLVVGDFGGPKAIRAIGDYLKAHKATVTAFYVSNVEQYLFTPNDTWRQFYTNVASLPVDSTSVILRATPAPRYIASGDTQFVRAHPQAKALAPDAFRAALGPLGIPVHPATSCVSPPPPRVVLDTVRGAGGSVQVIRKPGFVVGPSAGFGELAVCLASISELVRAFNAGLIQRYSQVVALSK